MKILVTLLFLISHNVLAQKTVWEYVDSKLEKKEFKRWSLSSWFYQKEKMALQDQWLAMNLEEGSVFWEFYLDYAGSDFDADTADNTNESTSGYSSEAAIYLGFLGFAARQESYDDYYTQTESSLNLRLVGSNHQATHLILTYGRRKFEGGSVEKFEQNFYGGDISLYLVPFFGFDGRYRIYLSDKSEDNSSEMESKRTQWGAFLDISFVRIYAYQFEENLEFTTLATGVTQERQIKGSALGMRLYF